MTWDSHSRYAPVSTEKQERDATSGTNLPRCARRASNGHIMSAMPMCFATTATAGRAWIDLPHLSALARKYVVDYAPEVVENIGHRLMVTTVAC